MSDERLRNLIEKVQANPKYQSISIDLVRRISEDAFLKGLSGKSAVKAVRNKLHQVGGAYFRQKINYELPLKELTTLPRDLQSEQVKDFCIRMMQSHASTAERLPILIDFFQICLESISPVNSIVDLACGMNPLAIPWMPLDKRFSYHACDIYLDMIGLIRAFFKHHKITGIAEVCDLMTRLPETDVQVALLLKSFPCLEQVDKDISSHLLESIQAQHILVSFPAKSLGGHKKGMLTFYKDHFYNLVANTSWQIREFTFPSELAFLVTK